MYRILVVVLVAGGLIACGGTSASRTPPTTPIPTGGNPTPPAPPTPTPTPTPSPTPAPPPPPSGAVTTPSIVQVAAGQTAAGVDIGVPAPSGTPANIQDLGVAALTGSASAFNTGDIIHQGATMRVIMFGPGLSGSMQVSILGPNDIQISDVRSTTANDPANTPGLSFTAAVAPNAALGARTVVLQSSNGNIATFTGGLEVVP